MSKVNHLNESNLDFLLTIGMDKKFYFSTMRFLLLAFLCLLTTETLVAQDLSVDSAGMSDLTVFTSGLKSDEGVLMVGLYADEENFLGDTPAYGLVGEIVDGQSTVIFKNIPWGNYAIVSYHDKDKNGKLKTGLFGIPREPYQSSRAANNPFGPPKWENAVFAVSSSAFSIRMAY